MSPAVRIPLALASAWPLLALAAPGGPEAAAPASIVRIALPDEEDERLPLALPTEPENTLEIDLPWPVSDWAGRGFTPDPEKYAGDFVVEAARGSPRIFVTPLAAQAHRVLHVVLARPGGGTRSLPIEFIPAPPGLAWRKVIVGAREGATATAPSVALSARAPGTRLREPGPDSEIGLLRTLRLMLNMSADGARAVAAANPALGLATFAGVPRSFGSFTVACRLAVRDSTTDTLGLCASVSNQTGRRLLFDPGSWRVRVGDRVYPVNTVDFAGELEPGASAAALLVLARGPDGEPTRLLPGNDFLVSVRLSGTANPRPVRRLNLEGFDP